MPVLFALTLFVSALLLFLVQPMIAKMVLPSLGGTPAVWNTCQVFFQAILLAGYTYSHVATGWIGVRKQSWVHLVVMALPFAVLPLSLREWTPPAGGGNPIGWLLLLLLVSVGLPFFVLSTTAPLLQKWFTETGHPSSKDPYFLYAASNIGSMLALLGYPTLVEPNIPVRAPGSFYSQVNLWAVGYGVLCALLLACHLAVRFSKHARVSKVVTSAPGWPADDPAPTFETRLRWIGLAFVPSSLMLGITTYITLDIAAIPLLWVLPLSLYLLSFIIVFAHWPKWCHTLTVIVMPLVVLLLIMMLETEIRPESFHAGNWFWKIRALFLPSGMSEEAIDALRDSFPYSISMPGIVMLIFLCLMTLFIVAMTCHGELAKTRPAPSRLTEFYLLMSLGGVLGGLFNALVAPIFFGRVIEHEVALIVACLLLPTLTPVGPLLIEKMFGWRQSRLRGWIVDAVVAGLVGLCFFGALQFNSAHAKIQADIESGVRNGPGIDQDEPKVGNPQPKPSDKPEEQPKPIGKPEEDPPVGFAHRTYQEAQEGVEWLAKKMNVDNRRVAQLLLYGIPILICFSFVNRPVRFGLAVAAFITASQMHDTSVDSPTLYTARSFFGVLKVQNERRDPGMPPVHALHHGTTLHGKQILSPQFREEPITYYSRRGPVGQVFKAVHDSPGPKSLAVVGLGSGTTACYGEKGDTITYYEIDNTVVKIASNPEYFTFLTDCRARGCEVKIELGDARLELVHAPDHSYNVIVVDAFSSDAIPIHLLTKQAFELYMKKLAPGGYLLVHISNRHLNLAPVVANLGKDLDLLVFRERDDDRGEPFCAADWMVVVKDWPTMARLLTAAGQPTTEMWQEDLAPVGVWPVPGVVVPTEKMLKSIRGDRLSWVPVGPTKKVGIWTDDYSNLLNVFMWE